MSRSRSVAELVASVDPIRVVGEFLRHAAPNRDAFAGGFGGRWGAAFKVIYLGRPFASCVEEAYRHLVDETGVPARFVKSRTLYRTRIDISSVLDLRDTSALEAVGLEPSDLTSEVGDYEVCQRVAAAAHQLELHGIIAPSASGFGETLAVFRERVQLHEMPEVISTETWTSLPERPEPGTSHGGLSVVRS